MARVERSDVAVLVLAACYASRSHEMHQRFLELYDRERIVIDMTALDLPPAAVLSELAQMRVYRNANKLLLGRLVVESSCIRNALRAVGFERHWPIFKTRDEALASFEGPPLFA